MAEKPIQLRTLYSMIVSAPKDAKEAADDNWQKESALFALLGSKPQRKQPIIPEWEVDHQNYGMQRTTGAGKQDSETIDADFTGMFDPLTRGKSVVGGTETN
jgi:hypothetical protein